MSIIYILIALMGLICAEEQEQLTNYLAIGQLECKGPNSSNYTFVDVYQLNCQSFNMSPGTKYLISCSPTGEKSVISLQNLAQSDYPAGAYVQLEALMLGTSGPLAGKYIYLKWINLVDPYLKKCSSILGYSYTLSTSFVILIADKLDVNMFTNPGGAYEPFKSASSTVCHGQTYTV